jgi:transposase
MSAKRSKAERKELFEIEYEPDFENDFQIVFKIRCGMDVHRDFIVACIATTDENGITRFKKRRFSTNSGNLRQCRDWLIEHGCFDVCMESTGKYWFPVYNILEQPIPYFPSTVPESRFNIVVTHPKYVKAIKGKKTDKRDAKWISNVFKFDMICGSFIPPEDIRQLRDLCRYWFKLSSFMTSEKIALKTALPGATLSLTRCSVTYSVRVRPAS